MYEKCDRDSALGVTTSYVVYGEVSEPPTTEIFSVPSQTVPEDHEASCKFGTGSVSQGKASGPWL